MKGTYRVYTPDDENVVAYLREAGCTINPVVGAEGLSLLSVPDGTEMVRDSDVGRQTFLLSNGDTFDLRFIAYDPKERWLVLVPGMNVPTFAELVACLGLDTTSIYESIKTSPLTTRLMINNEPVSKGAAEQVLKAFGTHYNKAYTLETVKVVLET